MKRYEYFNNKFGMNAYKLLALISKYEKCPNCGSEIIGNGQGGVIVEDETFTRTCKCGWKIKVDEDGIEVV